MLLKFALLLTLFPYSVLSCHPDALEGLAQVGQLLSQNNNNQHQVLTGDATEEELNVECSCGISRTFNRIVGGENADVNEYPWQSALITGNSNTPFCGGTLIHKRYVLTAAHCMEDRGISSLNVVLGEHDVSTGQESVSVIASVQEIIRHPGYNEDTVENDFALLKLEHPVPFGRYSHVRPACLPDREPEDGIPVIATGWGTTSESGPQAEILQEVVLSKYPDSVCESSYPDDFVSGAMICAGVDEGGKDACQGDSGGPLVRNAGGFYEVVGVTSWGFGCARQGQPGVFANVKSAESWILEHIGEPDCARPV